MTSNLNIWYRRICLDDNLDQVDDAIVYFENELIEARKDVNITGSVEQAASRLPGIFEYRYSQFQEVEAILRHLNINLDRERSIIIKRFIEHYNREMSVREAEKYVAGEDEIVAWAAIVNSFALIRNQYSGLLKGLDHKNWQISNIVKLRCAGIEDATIKTINN